jgi:Domain of unknown function (DUF4922)
MNSLEKVLSKDLEINGLASPNDYSLAAEFLLKKQFDEWQQLKDGYESLESVKFKTFHFGSFKIKFQYNPKRIISSSAKIDSKSIKERKCFLCVENLPLEQKAILYKDKFLILGNPFPIFPAHLTISSVKHVSQSIEDSFIDFLHASKDLAKHFTVFYNGPKCGASAPDHLHFQAGTKYFMPIDEEFHLLRNEFGKILSEDDNIAICSIDDGLRKFISLESKRIDKLQSYFSKLLRVLKGDNHEEPMINIISSYEEKAGWRVLVFLRAKHRSHHYYEQGDKNILWSPAAVDLGGVCITPLEKDFNNITKELINEVFAEIMVTPEKLHFVGKELKKVSQIRN